MYDTKSILSALKLHTHSKTPASFPGLVEFFLLLQRLVDFQTFGNTIYLLYALFPALLLVRFLKAPALELITQAA